MMWTIVANGAHVEMPEETSDECCCDLQARLSTYRGCSWTSWRAGNSGGSTLRRCWAMKRGGWNTPSQQSRWTKIPGKPFLALSQ